MKSSLNYYTVLGVPRDASDDDIKQAYRRGAFADHPDRNPGDREAEARFHACRDAYEVLADPARRAAHDRELQAAQRPRPSARRPTPARPAVSVRANRARRAGGGLATFLKFVRDATEMYERLQATADAINGRRWDRRARRWRDREGRFIAR
jgi:curved DNA-binding protein CbpA